MTTQVAIAQNDISIQMQKRAHHPFLIAGGFQNTDLAIPWLAHKLLHIVPG